MCAGHAPKPPSAVKHFLPVLLSSAILAIGSVSAADSGTPVKSDLVQVPVAPVLLAKANGADGKDAPAQAVAPPQPREPDPVQVPETIGVSVLAGVAFLFMFGRRRYA